MSRLFMATLPKSGTHVLNEFFGALGLNRHYVEDEQYHSLSVLRHLYRIDEGPVTVLPEKAAVLKELGISDEKGFFERLNSLRSGLIEDMLKMPEGCFVYNHYSYDRHLVDAVYGAGISLVYLYRDPRDYIVSLTNHIMRHPEHKHHNRFRAMESDDERYSALIKGSSQEGPDSITPMAETFRSMAGWLQDPRVFTMRFEEIIGPKGLGSRYVQYLSFEKLVKHIGFPVSTEELYDYIDSSYNEKHTLFVKGQIGQWKEAFSEGVLKVFHAYAGGLLEELGYDGREFDKAGSECINGYDTKRLARCLEHAEQDFLAERMEVAELRDRNKELENICDKNEEDSKARLELVNYWLQEASSWRGLGRLFLRRIALMKKDIAFRKSIQGKQGGE